MIKNLISKEYGKPMEIVIAILLALILIALVSGNKDSASSVGKAIRIGLFLFLIGLAWLILIGYSIYYYDSYSEQGWSDMLGIIIPVVLPPFLAWANKAFIKELFTKDNKTIFKTLGFLLLGVIAWVTVSILYQEQKKEDPNLGWALLIIGLIVSGSVLINRALNRGWRTAFTFQPSLWDQVNNRYEKLRDEENARWAEFESGWVGDKDTAEFDRLISAHYEKIDNLFKENDQELEKVRGIKKKDDWWLYAFYYIIVFICFGLISYVWDFVFAWVMALKFVKGREWVAYAILIGSGLAGIGLVADAIEKANNYLKKN